MKDLYYILGTERDCTPAQLTAAYRKLAQKLQAPGQERDYFLDRHFEEITEAYQILSDPGQRRRYDANFKKQQQQRLYVFKLKYVNIAVTLALLAFTGLFGYYVMKSLSGSKTNKVAAIQPVADPVIKHPKKKHKPKGIAHQKNKPVPTEVADETDSQPEEPVNSPIAVAKPAAVEKPKPPVEKKWVSTVVKPPVVNGYVPEVEDKAPIPVPATTSNIATLEGNVTGLIYLHQTPNYRSAVVASIPNHAKVSVLEKSQDFYKVSYNDQVGYVPKWTVRE